MRIYLLPILLFFFYFIMILIYGDPWGFRPGSGLMVLVIFLHLLYALFYIVKLTLFGFKTKTTSQLSTFYLFFILWLLLFIFWYVEHGWGMLTSIHIQSIANIFGPLLLILLLAYSIYARQKLTPASKI